MRTNRARSYRREARQFSVCAVTVPSTLGLSPSPLLHQSQSHPAHVPSSYDEILVLTENHRLGRSLRIRRRNVSHFHSTHASSSSLVYVLRYRGYKLTSDSYAEMAKDKKNKISHRGKALDELRQWMRVGV